MRAMDVRIMVIIGAIMIAMIKSRMRMRATIPEENMREILNRTLMVKIERKNALVEAPMMIREHVRYNTLLYKKYAEHTPRACEESYSYSCADLHPSRSSVSLAQVKVIRGEEESVQL
ncbi:hypothetical protein R3W88_019488 [Solanum pinnatisectum]|uniref:Uncharacterized protein n=1 Tax=Solanum pinnatisectum TaxID=50273 RepID=A0AAV9KJV1_9SOLN|nr:hypothetical protein R3W88_019488 [Solanum pinnatisectum]